MVNVSLFERHAGSTARHPSENIFIDNGMSLSDILRSGMKTEVKSSKKVSKVIDESARKNQSMSTGFYTEDALYYAVILYLMILN